MMKRPHSLLVLLASVLLLFGCKDGGEGETAADPDAGEVAVRADAPFWRETKVIGS